MCIEYCFFVNLYHMSAEGADERMINVDDDDVCCCCYSITSNMCRHTFY